MKIRNIRDSEAGLYLGTIFTRHALLVGIKDPINDLNKSDISDMIYMRFKNLSLEDIEYAFKMERFGMYDKKTDHYQLFNAEYVSTILNKFKKWLRQTKVEHDISLALPAPKETVEETNKRLEEEMNLTLNGIEFCYNKFVETNEIITGYVWIYDYFVQLGIMNPTPEEKVSMYERAKTKISVEAKSLSREDYKSVIKQLEQKKSSKAITKAQTMLLERFFYKIKEEKKQKGLEYIINQVKKLDETV